MLRCWIARPSSARLGAALAIEVVVEDGFDGAVGARTDLQRPAQRRPLPVPGQRL